MQEPDRKVVWAGVFVLVVLALELAWFLFIGPTDHNPYYATQCKSDCDIPFWASPEFWTAAFTAVLTGSTVLLWLETRRLARGADDQAEKMEASIAVAEKAAKAALTSATMAEKALIATDRPWIAIEYAAVGPLIFGERKINASIHFRLRNIGKSPATNVMLFTEMHPDVGVAKTQVSNSIRGFSPASGRLLGWGNVVFPDTFIESTREFEMDRQVFLDRIAEIAATPIDEAPDVPPAAPYTHSHPGLNALVYYGLPNAPNARAKHTMMILEINSADHPLGFDGTPCEVSPGRLSLEQSFSAAGEAS